MPGIVTFFRRLTGSTPKTSAHTPAKTGAPATPKPGLTPADTFAVTPVVTKPTGPVAGTTFYAFRGEPTLDLVAKGTSTLKLGDTGPAVSKLQEALLFAGYTLPGGATGTFSAELATAVKKLQTESGMTQASGTVDALTLVNLEAAAAKKLKYPAYDEMFADGVLSTTLGVGYDEAGNDKPTINKIVLGLVGNGTPANKGQGYTQLDVKRATDVQLKNVGIDPATVDRDASYFVKTFRHKGKDVKAVVKLVTPTTPKAKEMFAKGVAADDLVLYAGHGRYGSGPDFDDIHSAAGNFVIGQPYSAGHVTHGANDVKTTKMKSGYQLMLFSGCTTKYYLDDLRTKAQGKTTKNLDVLASTDLLYWGKMAVNPLETLKNVTGGASLNEMQYQLERLNKREGAKSVWTVDGIQDN